MQRILVGNTKRCYFPSTFLIPFIVEPTITANGPLLVGQWLVRNHPEWVDRDVELRMIAFDFAPGGAWQKLSQETYKEWQALPTC